MNLEPGVISSFVNVNGYKTHYVEAGNGDPVILVHGSGPGAHGWGAWRQAIVPLSKHFHVYAIDVLGYGYTDKPTNIVYSDQATTNHMAGFINALCLDKVFLIGSSKGAYMAAKYACDNPDRVRAILMVSSGSIASAMGVHRTAADMTGLNTLESYDGTPASMRKWMEVIVNDHSKITDELVNERVAFAKIPGHDYVQKSMTEYRNTLKTDTNQKQLYDLRHRLPNLTMPMKMIWGGKDGFAPTSFAGKLKDLLPNVSFEVFENSGHQTQNDESDRFNEAAIRFFQSVPKAATK